MAKHIILTDTALDPADVILVRRSGLPQVVGNLAADSYTVRDTSAPVGVTVTGTAVAAPANTAPPAISGTAQTGQTLTASEGTWTGSPALALQWLRGGTAIAGATGVNYLLTSSDAGAMISVRVTAANAGGTVSATSAGVGPIEAPLSAPAAFGASDWAFATAAATGQAVLTLSAVPAGTKAVDYTFDGGATVHTLMDSGTGERYIPGLTPAQSYSCQIRARNSAGASAWTAVRNASAGSVKGTAATPIATVPASGAAVCRYHMAALAGANGAEVLALSDLNGGVDLTAPAGYAPRLQTDRYGRKFTRMTEITSSAGTTHGLRNDTVATNKGEFAVFLVGRITPTSGNLISVNTTSGTSSIFLLASPAQGDTLPYTSIHNAPVTSVLATQADKFDAALPVGQLVLIGGVYRSASAAVARHYLNATGRNGGRAVNAEAGTGFRLGQIGMDLYEAVVVNGTLTNAEADAIAAALCGNWGLTGMTNALALEGDSITRGAGPDAETPPQWWARAQSHAGLADLIPANCKLFNTAISGNTLADITTQRDLAANWMSTSMSPARNTLVLQIGRNDYTTGIETLKSIYAGYFTGETGVLARGFNVQVVANINDTANLAAMVMLREWLIGSDFLNAIGAGPGQQYEGRVKVVQTYLAEDAGIRPLFSDAGGSAYYTDGVHPNAAGTRVMTTGGDTPRYGILADIA